VLSAPRSLVPPPSSGQRPWSPTVSTDVTTAETTAETTEETDETTGATAAKRGRGPGERATKRWPRTRKLAVTQHVDGRERCRIARREERHRVEAANLWRSTGIAASGSDTSVRKDLTTCLLTG
jgi:hypothetical protein